MLNHFLYLSWSILVCLNLSRPILVQLGFLDLFQFIIVHLWLSWVILGLFVQKFDILGYLGLFQAILDYPGHTCILGYLHTCILAYLLTCIFAYLHTCTLAYLHTNIPTYLHTCIFKYLHTCIIAYLHTCIPIYLHTCILAYFYTCKLAIHPGPSWTISEYICLFRSIFGYIGISLVISSYLYCYLWLFRAISGYLELFWLSLAISDYLYQVSRIRVQVEAGESNLSLFKTFSFFFYYSFFHISEF